MRLMLAAAAILAVTSVAHAAGPILKSTPPCTYNSQGTFCLQLDSNSPLVITAQSITFKAPSAGTALVSVIGSGACDNFTTSGAQVGDFSTQITTPDGDPDYRQAGGNRFVFVIPGSDNPKITDGFNLAAQRQYSIRRAGAQQYALRIAVNEIDSYVQCQIYSVAMTVLFIPS